MAFKPAGSDHAVVSNTVSLTVAPAVPDTAVTQLKARQAPWSNMLPAIRDSSSVEVTILPEGPQLKRHQGIEFAFLKPDGTSTWSLKIGGPDIAVDCNLYTRWNRVWTQTKNLFGEALAFVSEESPRSVTTFSMTVLDRFVTSSYSDTASHVFRASPYLSGRSFGAESLWHEHTGWLDRDENGELLQNINVDVLPIDPRDKSQGKMINVSHFQRVTLTPPIEFSADSDSNATRLDMIGGRMHERNKEALRAMLTEEMQRTIKLNGEKR